MFSVPTPIARRPLLRDGDRRDYDVAIGFRDRRSLRRSPVCRPGGDREIDEQED